MQRSATKTQIRPRHLKSIDGYRRDKQPRLSVWGLIAIMLASSMTIMVGSAITPAVPAIGEQFGLGSISSWLVTMPALGVVASALVFGKLIDRKGPYIVCVTGLLLYGILGFSGFLMPTTLSLLLSRFLLGVATAAVMTSSTALISYYYKGEKQLKMVAAQGMVIELGGVFYLSVAGILTDTSWKHPFFIYLIAIVAFVAMLLFVKKPEVTPDAQAVEQPDPVEEALPKKPILPVLVLAFLAMTVFFTCIVSIPSYFQQELGYPASLSGYYLAGVSLIAVCCAGFMPKVVSKIGARGSLTIAFSCFAAAHLCLFVFTQVGFLLLAVVLLGVGVGFSIPLINNMTVARSTARNKGRNLSFYSMCIFSGQFFSSVLSMAASGRYVFLAACLVALIPLVGMAVKALAAASGKTRQNA